MALRGQLWEVARTNVWRRPIFPIPDLAEPTSLAPARAFTRFRPLVDWLRRRCLIGSFGSVRSSNGLRPSSVATFSARRTGGRTGRSVWSVAVVLISFPSRNVWKEESLWRIVRGQNADAALDNLIFPDLPRLTIGSRRGLSRPRRRKSGRNHPFERRSRVFPTQVIILVVAARDRIRFALNRPCRLHDLRWLVKLGPIAGIPPSNTRENDESFAWTDRGLHGCCRACVRCLDSRRSRLLWLLRRMLCSCSSLLPSTSSGQRHLVCRRSLQLLQVRSFGMRSRVLCGSNSLPGRMAKRNLRSQSFDLQVPRL